ncbi:site-specific DNA-methyltransferase [Rothia mucilaginosa]|uniref:site-specific DNA-methyltransferase n=1 Tax=Rothia mucilaginosa TaxID=43675 RepID=UPI0026EEC2F4|nr:site-specific DNA-methyltransferase [Rothia mucilaginosa]
MTWPGKREAQRVAQLPTSAAIHPQFSDSVDWESTRNVFIEGENLETLKALRTAYRGKVKMVYIDPPYNTGHDFVYSDQFAQTVREHEVETGARDAEGALKAGTAFEKNAATSGAFHSNWLSMMYPRLVLARELLAEDGVLVMSIDDDEMPRLRMLADNIFGEHNFYASVVWQKKYSPANDAKRFSDMHDYLLVYSRSEQFVRGLFPRTEENNKPYKYDDGDGRGRYRTGDLSVRTYSAANDYPVTNPHTGAEHTPPAGRCWGYSSDAMHQLIADNRIYWGKNNDGAPQLKRYLSEVQQGTVPTTWWPHEFAGHNDEARKEIRDLFDTTAVFDTPKPTRVIKRLLQVCTTPNSEDIILDFFAGSGTTAHAVMAQNAGDGGNRRFILVQLPEELQQKKGSAALEYSTVSAVTRERIRRAGQKVRKEYAEQIAQRSADNPLDTGFRAFTLGESCFKSWKIDSSIGTDDLDKLFDELGESIKPGTDPYDILFELLLKSDCLLNVELTPFSFGYTEFYAVGSGALAFTHLPTEDPATIPSLEDWEKAISKFREIYGYEPVQLIMIEDALSNEKNRVNVDSLKLNLVQLAKQHGINREAVLFA